MLLGDINIVVAVTSLVLNQNCRGSGLAYRTDIENAQAFINLFLE